MLSTVTTVRLKIIAYDQALVDQFGEGGIGDDLMLFGDRGRSVGGPTAGVLGYRKIARSNVSTGPFHPA